MAASRYVFPLGEGPRKTVEGLYAHGWRSADGPADADVILAEATLAADALTSGRAVVAWADDGALRAAALAAGCAGHVRADAPPSLVAAELEHARRQAEVQTRHSGQLAWLTESGLALSATRDLHETVRLLLEAATRLVGAEGGSIWLWDGIEGEERPVGSDLVCRFVAPDKAFSLLDTRLERGAGIAGWVAERRFPAVVPNVDTDPRFAAQVDSQTGFRTRSLIAVPLVAREECIGVLEVVNKRAGSFDEADLAWVQSLAGPAALAAENARVVRALARKNAELTERNDALDAFAYTVAHDLKRPLVSLVGYADILTEEPEDAPELAPRLSRLGRDCYRIVEELLLLAQLKGADIPQRALDMGTTIQAVLDRHAAEIAAAGATIHRPAAFPAAIGYAPWLEQVWSNYLVNGLKYGGEPPDLTFGADALEGGLLRFYLADRGAGLGEADRARVFEAFARAHVGGEGVGIGLSIVARIMDRLGGAAGVSENPGGGCRFHFDLPAFSG